MEQLTSAACGVAADERTMSHRDTTVAETAIEAVCVAAVTEDCKRAKASRTARAGAVYRIPLYARRDGTRVESMTLLSATRDMSLSGGFTHLTMRDF